MASGERPGEFEFIRRYLAPLSGEGGFALTDDAAELIAGEGWVVTSDMMIAGRHFLADDPLDGIAQKALRANLSDLAAKGAAPVHYMLSLALPDDFSQADMAALASGLAEDQTRYGVKLLGGDTTATNGPLTLSITALGKRPDKGMMRRNGAQAGDRLYVTGRIGEAWLGLQALQGRFQGEWAGQKAAYRQPEPPVALAAYLPGLASAALDISDGLLADAGHIARQSGKRLEVDLSLMPVSEQARRWIEADDAPDDRLLDLATGGDDYQILFAAPPSAADAVAYAADQTGIGITRIGGVSEGEGVNATGRNGPVWAVRAGFTHF